MASTRASAAAGGAALIRDAINRGAAAVEGAQYFQDSGAALGIELAVEADRAVGAGANPQFPRGFGLVGGGFAVRVEVGEQALTDAGQGGGVEPAGGVREGLLGLGDLLP